MLLEERSKNALLAKKVEDTAQVLQRKEKKISSLKKEVMHLSDSLRAEKNKSRMTILKLIDDVEDSIAESLELKEDANEKMSAVDLAVLKEKEKAQLALRKEREFTSFAVASCKLHSNGYSYCTSSPLT